MGRLILVADDSATIQKVIKIAFSRYPIEIIEAASYIEALAATAQSRPEALIIDASLPGSKGPEDFAKLRQEAGQVPALLLIGTYEAVDEAAFRQAGFTHILKKPFDTSDITAKMEALLGASFIAATAQTSQSPPQLHPPNARPPQPIAGSVPDFLPPRSIAGDRSQHAAVVHKGGLPGLADLADLGADFSTESDIQSPLSSLDAPADAPRARATGSVPGPAAGRPPLPLIPPPPSTDEAQRGRRAFAGSGQGAKSSPANAAFSVGTVPPVPLSFNLEDDDFSQAAIVHGPTTVKKSSHDRALAEGGAVASASLLAGELPHLVRQAVEDYCERHFKSLAREIIAAELRRLADDKARHLVDN